MLDATALPPPMMRAAGCWAVRPTPAAAAGTADGGAVPSSALSKRVGVRRTSATLSRGQPLNSGRQCNGGWQLWRWGERAMSGHGARPPRPTSPPPPGPPAVAGAKSATSPAATARGANERKGRWQRGRTAPARRGLPAPPPRSRRSERRAWSVPPPPAAASPMCTTTSALPPPPRHAPLWPRRCCPTRRHHRPGTPPAAAHRPVHLGGHKGDGKEGEELPTWRRTTRGAARAASTRPRQGGGGDPRHTLCGVCHQQKKKKARPTGTPTQAPRRQWRRRRRRWGATHQTNTSRPSAPFPAP